MPLLPAPAQLSHPEKDALIAALTARLALATHIAKTDRRAGRPHRSAGGAAQRTDPPTEDPRQLLETAVARTEARPPGRRARIARRAKAAPASAGRYIRTRIERSTNC